MKILSAFFLASMLPSICVGNSYGNKMYTVRGSGPDKWASAWYIENYFYSKPEVEIVNDVLRYSKNNLFDVDDAAFKRTGKYTTYSTLLSSATSSQPIAVALGEIIHEIEIDAWSGEVTLPSRIVEQGFRNMQLRYGREEVTKTCYLEFFDNVAAEIEDEGLLKLKSPDELIPAALCLEVDNDVSPASISVIDSSVPTVPLQEVLHLTANNQSPIYIDTRETWEFQEGHIPGALNLKLREIDEESAHKLMAERLVIAYCVKDFRGFEAARKLRSYGVNAAIMTPHGMRGWIEAKLPVAGPRGMPEEQAVAELERVAMNSLATKLP